ncbi:hypothetical protein ACJJTC_019286 [Scirpophaga incertulas]
MQVIAHLTDQMAYEISDDPPAKPTTASNTPPRPVVDPTRPTRPVASPPRPTARPPRPVYNPPRPTITFKPTRPPYVSIVNHYPGNYQLWNFNYGTGSYYYRQDKTTPYHKPGLYAPSAPPQADERPKGQYVLLPLENNSEYTVIEPPERKTEEPLLSMHEEEVKPLVEPSPEEEPLLPPHFDDDKLSRSDVDADEIDDESLQYLSQNVREMIKMAYDTNDDKLVDVWEGLRSGPEPIQKIKMTSSNLRLLLLYDLLSREAKKQRLSDYAGFSPDVMRALVDSSSGGAREQLKMALSRMLERRDCTHEYANNRAREMVVELGKDESKMSAELRYLQPLVYNY